MNDLAQLLDILSGQRHVYIQTHNFPDPDAVASAYGLQKLLLQRGITSEICYDRSIDTLSVQSMLRHLPIEIHHYSALDLTEDDTILLVDVQKGSNNVKDIPGSERGCIDHHPTDEKSRDAVYAYADLRITGACASMIAEYYFNNGIVPESTVASALLYGIKMDTDDFSRGVTQLDVDMYAKLFQYADHDLVTRLTRNTMQQKDLDAYVGAIQDIQYFGNCGCAFIDPEEYDGECSSGLIAMIADFILKLDDVDISIVFAPQGDKYRFSVRSEDPDMDAGVLIDLACHTEPLMGGGGGHAVMAGGSAKILLPDTASSLEVHTEVTKAFEQALKQYREMHP